MHKSFIILAQELLQEISEKCFKVCVTKPSSSLSSSEQVISLKEIFHYLIFFSIVFFSKKCLGFCLDRYFDALSIVSRAYTQRLQKELSNAR